MFAERRRFLEDGEIEKDALQKDIAVSTEMLCEVSMIL